MNLFVNELSTCFMLAYLNILSILIFVHDILFVVDSFYCNEVVRQGDPTQPLRRRPDRLDWAVGLKTPIHHAIIKKLR